jgi:hypothetical protein
MDNQCTLLEHRQCCCACKNLKEDRSHPCTDGRTVSDVRGYICNPEEGVYFSGWDLHSYGCELFQKKDVS